MASSRFVLAFVGARSPQTGLDSEQCRHVCRPPSSGTWREKHADLPSSEGPQRAASTCSSMRKNEKKERKEGNVAGLGGLRTRRSNEAARAAAWLTGKKPWSNDRKLCGQGSKRMIFLAKLGRENRTVHGLSRMIANVISWMAALPVTLADGYLLSLTLLSSELPRPSYGPPSVRFAIVVPATTSKKASLDGREPAFRRIPEGALLGRRRCRQLFGRDGRPRRAFRCACIRAPR